MDADGVVAIATAVRSGARSAVDVTQEHLDAAKASQSALNAFTFIDDEAALEAALAIDRRVARGEAVGPLAGVPIGVKDLIDHAGRPTTNGSSFAPTVPERSAPCVTRLEAADAVIIGRTGLHEYAFGFSSENDWFGPVRNPWDSSLSPGGSSGGSGAATAAGLCAAAIGTDTGGSVRVPAALCGVVGLKVTHGRVPLTGVTPLAESIDTVGPLGRSVADVAAVYSVIAGDDPPDPWSRPQPVLPVTDPAVLSRLTIGVPHPWVDQPTDGIVVAAFRAALDDLAAAGARVIELDIPELDFPGEIQSAMYPEVASVHRSRLADRPDGYGPSVRDRLNATLECDTDQYIAGLRWRSRVQAVASRSLSEVDVLMTPTVAALRKPIGDDRVALNGEAVPYRSALSRFTALVNHLRFPALALPLPAAVGPPPSLQLIGTPWSEHRLLELGLALETADIVTTTRPSMWRPTTST